MLQIFYKISLVLLLIFIFGLAFIAFQPGWMIRMLANQSPNVLYSVDTQRPVVALTIDDGPDPVTTPRILDILKKHNAHATFFMIGNRITGNEAIVDKATAENHEVANHMMNDEPSINLPPAEFEQRLLASDETLSKFASPRWFRPGSGWYNQQMLSTLSKHGYKAALGSVYPYDPHIPSSWFAAQSILWNIRPGSVIILHDYGNRGERTLATLQTILPRLTQQGYQVVTLSELSELQESTTNQ